MSQEPLVIDALGGNIERAIDAAVGVLAYGYPVGLPTDTVYGLGVDPSVPGATDRVFAAKERPRGVLLPVLVADPEQALRLVVSPSDAALALMAAFWPGPLTIVLRRTNDLDLDLGDDGPRSSAPATVGVRCPAHPVPRLLCEAVGPLAVTSANRHGEAEATSAEQVASTFGAAVPLVLDAGICDGAPSTVVDCTGPEPLLLRPGSITWEELLLVVAE